MKIIRIELLGDVAFERHIKVEEGYRCDVPTDRLGIPYLPLVEALRTHQGHALSGHALVGLARPVGYLGLAREAAGLIRSIPNGANRIRALYTREHVDGGTGLRMRSIRGGQVFFAPLRVADEHLERMAAQLGSITHIGISEGNVTGEVSCSLVEVDVSADYVLDDSPLLTYSSLEYTLLLLAPTSFYAPFEEGDKTYDHIPGAEMRRALSTWRIEDALLADLPTMRFSNAYVTLGNRRQVPLPMCFSVVKLDREQLRYRLAPGKDPNRLEQDINLEGAYGVDFDERFVTYVKPVVERITSSDGDLLDALEAGQILKGTVYGTDEQLRRLATRIKEHPYLSFGSLTEEGYGMAYCVVDALREEHLACERLMSRFDVSCVSHTLIYDERGVPATRPEDLLHEIERTCGLAEGDLVLDGAYTDIYTDYYDRLGWGSGESVTRCLQAGSVLRVHTKDGRGVDVSPVLHTFVGEGCRDGYGELMTWPATDAYYRVTAEAEPDSYRLPLVPTVREQALGADMVLRVLRSYIKRVVESIADTDATVVATDGLQEHEVPLEILKHYLVGHNPTADIAELVGWYEEAFERALVRRGELRGAIDDASGAMEVR